ncbi:MAG: alpha/beta hydrolase [Clostridia bacterium]|nr:alpha/beta hydrolase [Clostridia bacterium]
MLQESFIRLQLSLFKPFVSNCSLKTARDGQDKLGLLMTSMQKKQVTIKDISLCSFDGAMISPKQEQSGGVILYLHGGGYTCGNLTYAKGFGTTLAANLKVKVLCPAYRLAPEFPFPAALEDAFAAYKYLLSSGYRADEIILCGESAGGGLIFSLCFKLKENNYEMPAGIIAISPWTDLTLSGKTFETNENADPSMTKQRLKFYADCYVHGTTDGIKDEKADREMKAQPLISPLFGILDCMPPSLIFAGGDEIMLDDARLMQKALLDAGRSCRLIVREGMWHGYVLYSLKQNSGDFDEMAQFLSEHMSQTKRLRYIRLDNAAKIYPAIKTKRWNNYFRLSATLNEPVDREVLQAALDVTVHRFPSIAVRLKRGVFWYYLEEVPNAPEISEEYSYPLIHTPFDDVRKCAFRVIHYKNRISAEFFHAITDGNGGLVFLKTLLAEYISRKYSVQIPTEDGVLDRLEAPHGGELEDSFLKYGGDVGKSLWDKNAFHFSGTPEPDGFCTDTAFIMDADRIVSEAKKRGVTVTALLTAALVKATISAQEHTVKNPRRRKDVKVLLPVNLRNIFPSRTLRNFALYTIAGVDVRLGEYSFDELCTTIYHQMKLTITEKQLRRHISANISIERNALVRVMPLFIKNIAMKTAFNLIGERTSSFSFSNLGVVSLPEPMTRYISRMDFVLGVQLHSPYNVGAVSYNKTLYMNFIRNIKEPILEYRFWEVMREIGIHAKVESNQRNDTGKKE